MVEQLPFALPDIGDREIDAVVASMRSGWISSGPRVIAFEEAFRKNLGEGVHAVAINSATAGLHLALEALGIGAGDEVIVPTWTFTATAEVVSYMGARPVLVDVCEDTLNIDLAAAERAVTARTRAIMPVHFAGLPVSPSRVATFATEHGLAIVEDAAHALPAAAEGIQVGAGHSDATVFSFYATKTLTTGEGGMLCTRRADVADRARVMRLHGMNRQAYDRYRGATPAWQYDVIAPGFKYNLTDTAAALGLVQLARTHEMRDRRAAIAAIYNELLDGLGLALPKHGDADAQHAWHLYVVRVPQTIGRDKLIEALAQQGVGTSVHFIPLHFLTQWRESGPWEPEDFPVATSAFEQVVSLPIYSSMSDAAVHRVVDAIRTFVA